MTKYARGVQAMTMLEKSARALCSLAGGKWDARSFSETPSGESPDEMRDGYFEQARAVLMAIRDPSEEFMCHMYPDPTYQGMILTRQGDRSRRAGRLQIAHLVDSILSEAHP